jgi:hypothetical protein
MRPSVSLGLSQSSLETFFPWRCRSNCCSWASVGASSSAFEVTDEIHLKEDARRDRTPPDRARVVRSTESPDERVGVVLGKKLVQCRVERVTGRLRHVRGRDERLQLPTVSASLAVRGKSLPWPFSTWATPKKAKVFLGSPVAVSCGGRLYPQSARAMGPSVAGRPLRLPMAAV